MNSQLVTTAPAASHIFSAGPTQSQEVLSFRLGDEEYGISLLCVQEIRSYQAPTRLAGAEEHLLGVIDLRGEVVPLIDMRRRFGLPVLAFNDLTVTIVISLGDRRVGVVVDQVNDVVALLPDQVRLMPPLQSCADQRHMVAIGSIGPRMLVLLDIEALLRSSELGLVVDSVLQ